MVCDGEKVRAEQEKELDLEGRRESEWKHVKDLDIIGL